VEPGEIQGRDVVIEPDLSNAGPFLAAAVVTGGTVSIPNWPITTTQVGRDFVPILEAFGATCELTNGSLRVTAGQTIRGVDLNLEHAGELAPTVAAIAALADSPSRIVGIAHLRGHETDRLAALTREINNLGGAVTELADGLVINPKPLGPGNWSSYHDHRMATAGAIIGLRVAGVRVENIATTQKTIPNFPELWTRLLGIETPTVE
jgi:3-phosphoshikimate 1-carboxyvinyltransferase